jgi:hypothetical protein
MVSVLSLRHALLLQIVANAQRLPIHPTPMPISCQGFAQVIGQKAESCVHASTGQHIIVPRRNISNKELFESSMTKGGARAPKGAGAAPGGRHGYRRTSGSATR